MISGVIRENSQKKTAFACAKFSNSQNVAIPNTINSAMRAIFFRLSSMEAISFFPPCGKDFSVSVSYFGGAENNIL